MRREIVRQELDSERFIQEKVADIKAAVADGMAINALSGGVDSSVVTMLGHRALGKQLRTVFIDNGLMRAGEPEQVVGFFQALGVTVEVIDARQEFFCCAQGDHRPGGETRGHHADLLPQRIRAHRQGKRRQTPAPGYDPHRY